MIRKILNIREWVTRSKVLIFMPEKDKYKTGTLELIFFRPDLGLIGNLYFMNLGIEARPVWSVPASLSSADGYGVKANCSQGVPVQIQWPKICHRLNLSIFCFGHIHSLLPCPSTRPKYFLQAPNFFVQDQKLNRKAFDFIILFWSNLIGHVFGPIVQV